jgi:hypothetical protein
MVKRRKRRRVSSKRAKKPKTKSNRKKSKSIKKKARRYSSFVIDKLGKVVLRDSVLRKKIRVGCRQILRLVSKTLLLRLINKRKTRF